MEIYVYSDINMKIYVHCAIYMEIYVHGAMNMEIYIYFCLKYCSFLREVNVIKYRILVAGADTIGNIGIFIICTL